MTGLQGCLLVSSLLFAVGLAGALTRRNSILVLAGIELMLNAANLNFVAFWHFGRSALSQSQPVTGLMFVLFANWHRRRRSCCRIGAHPRGLSACENDRSQCVEREAIVIPANALDLSFPVVNSCPPPVCRRHWSVTRSTSTTGGGSRRNCCHDCIFCVRNDCSCVTIASSGADVHQF